MLLEKKTSFSVILMKKLWSGAEGYKLSSDTDQCASICNNFISFDMRTALLKIIKFVNPNLDDIRENNAGCHIAVTSGVGFTDLWTATDVTTLQTLLWIIRRKKQIALGAIHIEASSPIDSGVRRCAWTQKTWIHFATTAVNATLSTFDTATQFRWGLPYFFATKFFLPPRSGSIVYDCAEERNEYCKLAPSHEQWLNAYPSGVRHWNIYVSVLRL